MKWREYTLHTTVEAEDTLAYILSELGVEGVEIDDNIPPSDEDLEAMFTSPEPELMPEGAEPPDGTARLRFFLHEEDPDEVTVEAQTAETVPVDDSYTIHDRIWSEEEIRQLLELIQENLDNLRQYMDVGEGRLEVSESRDTDWRDNWKQFYKPLRAGRILILPAWEEIPEEWQEETASGELKVVKIEPGAAFGTGTHESTRLCLDALEMYLKKGDRILDIGTGSGILGLAALAQGADFAFGTEMDPACSAVIEENRQLNTVEPERFPSVIGNILEDEAVIRQAGSGYDLVCANILAPVIEALLRPGKVDYFLKPGGLFISSGIIDSKEADVLAALAANPSLELVEVRALNEWRSILARKRL